MDSKIQKRDDVLLDVIRVGTAILLVIMFVVIILEVIFRYILASPVFWTEELARYVMFYMVLVGSAAGIRQGQHPVLTFVVQEFPVRFRRKWYVAIDGLVFFVLILVFWQGWVMAAEEWIGRTAALRISFFWVYLALPIGSFLMMVELVAKYTHRPKVSNSRKANESVAEEE